MSSDWELKFYESQSNSLKSIIEFSIIRGFRFNTLGINHKLFRFFEIMIFHLRYLGQELGIFLMYSVDNCD